MMLLELMMNGVVMHKGKVESEHLSLKKFGDFYKEQKYSIKFC